LRSAIARTFVISMDHQAGTTAVSVARRFNNAVVFGVAPSWNSQAMAIEQSTTRAALTGALR